MLPPSGVKTADDDDNRQLSVDIKMKNDKIKTIIVSPGLWHPGLTSMIL